MIQRKPRVPMIMQSTATECAVACVAMISSYYGLQSDVAAMRRRLSASVKGVTMKDIALLAAAIHLSARGVRLASSRLDRLAVPAILHWDLNHFVVLVRYRKGIADIHDPAIGRRRLSKVDLDKHFTGVALELAPRPSFAKGDERQRFGMPELLRAVGVRRLPLGQLAFVSLVLEALAIAIPMFPQIVVDQVVLARDSDLLTVVGVGFVLLAVSITVFSAIRALLGHYIGARIGFDLLDGVFNRILQLPLSWFERRQIGDVISRYRSIDTIQRTMSVTFIEGVIDGVMVSLILIVLAVYSPDLAGLAIAVAGLCLGIRLALNRVQTRLLREKLVHEGRATTYFLETLRGALSIRANGRQQDRRSGYLTRLVEQINCDVRVSNLQILQKTLTVLCVTVGGVVIVWVGALKVLDEQLTIGMLFAAIGFQALFLSRIQILLERLFEFRLLAVQAERLSDIVMAEPERPTALDPETTPEVRISSKVLRVCATQLGYSYGVEGFAFRNVTMEVASGEVVVVAGASGVGKTTLVKVLTGLIDRTEGLLTVCGHDLRLVSLEDYRSRIGMVMQEDQLFVGSIEENICFFDSNLDAERVRHAARKAAIHDEILAMPMQYETLIGSLSSGLSGGQRQRLLLARALYREPSLMFLDETFDQVGLAAEEEIVTGLRTAGVGLVIVSHRPQTRRFADRVVELGQT